MKIKYGELINKHRVLIAVGNLVLPRTVSMAIARNIIKIEEELRFVASQRRDIALRHAKKDEKGQFILDEEQKNYTFESEESLCSFLDELNTLEECEVEVSIMKFKADDLQLCDASEKYDSITAVQEASICWMIDYE